MLSIAIIDVWAGNYRFAAEAVSRDRINTAPEVIQLCYGQTCGLSDPMGKPSVGFLNTTGQVHPLDKANSRSS